MSYWWEKLPERLKYEIELLEKNGCSCSKVEEAFSQGVAVLKVTTEIKNYGKLELEVKFPDTYPKTRFQIYCDDLDLDHHQNPHEKNLCLIGQLPEKWKTTYTVAGFIKNRLPDVIEAGLSDDLDKLANIEEIQAEPMSVFYPYLPSSMILADSSWNIDKNIDEGILRIGIQRDRINGLYGAILKVEDKTGTILAEANESIRNIFSRKVIDGRWIRAKEPVKIFDPKNFIKVISESSKFLNKNAYKSIGHGFQIDVIGVIFPEEQKWRENNDGWVFSLKINANGKKRLSYLKNNNIKHFEFVRSGYAGHEDFFNRTPGFKTLASKKVAVFGLGCLGGQSAIELAKSGVGELNVWDFDYIKPGNTIRWPFGLSTVPNYKADVISNFIKINYPYTKVTPFLHRIGDVGGRYQINNTLGLLEDSLGDVDLIFDATAAVDIQHILSDIAYEKSIPYICISTTPGIWGGTVVRIDPRYTDACWFCFRHQYLNETITNPHADPEGLVQPVGCGSPTFIGSYFDASNISYSGVRMAISSLATDDGFFYPRINWDVAILNLRDATGEIIPPSWVTYKLNRYDKCHCKK
jgi:hypothetical protein